MKLFEEQWIRGAKPTTKPRDGESGGGKLTKQIGKRSRTETAGGKCKDKEDRRTWQDVGDNGEELVRDTTGNTRGITERWEKG